MKTLNLKRVGIVAVIATLAVSGYMMNPDSDSEVEEELQQAEARVVLNKGLTKWGVEPQSFTPSEYIELRSPSGKIISKLAHYRAGHLLPLQDVALIEGVLTIEVNDCGGITLEGLNSGNYQEKRWDWLWNKLTADKCK